MDCSLAWCFGVLEFLPRDLLPSLDEVRRWAADQDLLRDPESQLITPERAEAVSKLFTADDQLRILVHVHAGDSGELNYLERVYMPAATLIKKRSEVRLAWWEVPIVRDTDGYVLEGGEVRFGFWHPGSDEESCSMSTGRLVVKKFKELLHQIGGSYEARELTSGVQAVTVDGQVREVTLGTRGIIVNGKVGARFFKTGPYFDVEFLTGGPTSYESASKPALAAPAWQLTAEPCVRRRR